VIGYIDASVLLRLVLSEPETLAEWNDLTEGVTSQIAIVECHRGLFRALATKRLDDASFLRARETVEAILDRLRIVRISRAIIEAASQPFPVTLGSLDAIHLASAIRFRARRTDELIRFATHDQRLAEAASAMNFPVLGA
jgi:predicted nucleic acid-binding protein